MRDIGTTDWAEYLSDAQIDRFMDYWWQYYPRLYESYYRKCNKVQSKMMEKLLDDNPRTFEILFRKV